MNQFKAIESVRLRTKRAKRKKKKGEKINPSWAWLRKKMDQLVVYTSLVVVVVLVTGPKKIPIFCPKNFGSKKLVWSNEFPL